MHADDLVGPAGSAAEGDDVEARGVAGKDGIWRGSLTEAGKNFNFEVEAFGDYFDDHIGGGECSEIFGSLQRGEGFVTGVGIEAALVDLLTQAFGDGGKGSQETQAPKAKAKADPKAKPEPKPKKDGKSPLNP